MKNILPPFFTQLISGRLLRIKGSLIGYCCLLFLLTVNTASAAPFAYLNAGDSVAVVDVETLTEVERIDVGRNLSYLDVRPGGNYLYGVMGRSVSGTTDREITVIDTSSHTLAATFEVPVHDSVLAYLTLVTSSPDGQRIYAVDSENYLYFIDAHTHSVLHVVQVDNAEEYWESNVWDIDVLPDSSVVMVAVNDKGIFRFYDTQSFASKGVGGFSFFHDGIGAYSVRANPKPAMFNNDQFYNDHMYYLCGSHRSDPDLSGCVVTSSQLDPETDLYGTGRVIEVYDFVVPGVQSPTAKLAYSYDGRLAFINAAGGPWGARYASLRVIQGNLPSYIGTLEFPTNNSEPHNIDTHPGKHEVFVYTGKADLYRAAYVRAPGFPGARDSIHISGGGLFSGHFVGGPMQLTASIQPGSITFPHLPIAPSSQQVFSFHNHLNLKPVGLQCSLDTEQAFAIDGGDINITLQPDETLEFTVNFSTTVAGQYTDTLRCSDSNNGEFIYALEGHYVTPVTATPASGSNIILPTQWPATGATQQTINFQNNNLTNANLSCSVNESTGEFSAATSLVVPANGNANLVVQLNSINAGLFTGTLNCASDVGGSLTYYLSGETITPLEVQPIWPSPVKDTILEMGYIYPFQSELQRTLSFKNVSITTLGFSCGMASDDSGFTLAPFPTQVTAGDIVDITVTYRSNVPARDTLAQLDCEDGTGQQWTYYFRADAQMPIDAIPAKNSDVILPQQRVGTAPTSASFTLSNRENLIDGVYFICATHMLTPPFTSTTGATLRTLPAGSEESFDVEFDSTTAGDFSTTLGCWVFHNDIGEGLIEEFEYTLKASAFYALTSSPRSGSTVNLPDVSIDPASTTADPERATNATISFQNHVSVDESLSCSLNDGSVFAISSMPMTIPANSSASLTTTFNPNTPGEYTDTLTCSSSSGDLFNFTLMAQGVPRRTEMLLPLPEGPHSGKMLHLSITDSEWNLDSAQSLTAASLGAALPSDMTLPHGALSLRLTDGTLGNISTVVLTYPFDLPAGARYYKYGPTADNPAAHWYPFAGAVISGNTITLTLTDGGAGDSDLSVNGIIDDPGGPVWVSTASDVTAIPTLPQWAMMLLAGIMGMLALNRVQRIRNT